MRYNRISKLNQIQPGVEIKNILIVVYKRRTQINFHSLN